MKTYNNIYVFGDSYSTPFVHVDPEDSFWYRAGADAKAKHVHNYSSPGNSVEGIVHLITSMHESFDWDGLFLIGIPPLERMTAYRDTDSANQHLREYTVFSEGTVTNEVIWAQESLYDWPWASLGRDLLRVENRGWTEARVLRELYLLEFWLRHEKKANFMFVNLSKKFIEQDKWLPSKTYVNHFMNSSNAIIFGNGTYYDINLGVNKPPDYDSFGWCGHHSSVGNENFYTNSLKPALIEAELL